jgi:hypothetical protein
MTRCPFRAAIVVLLLCSTPLGAQRSDRRVIDAAGIAAAGWHRIGDIAAALPPGTAASADGFNYDLTASRLGFMESSRARASWIVRVDGQAMPMAIGGLWILDAIPVAITQVDSIVISEGPRLADGQVALVGVIDLFTRQPRRGPSVIADYQHGDETGDPGPYRYTARSTPNLEKLGPLASGAVAFGVARASVDIAARYASLNATDPRLVSNIGASGFVQQDVNASGGAGIATLHAAGTHHVIAGRGRFTGLMRIPAIARFQSARVVTSHVGLSGGAAVGGRNWRYAATWTTHHVDRLNPDAFPFLIGQERTIADAFIAVGLSRRLHAGLGVEGATVEPDDEPAQAQEKYRGWITYGDTTAAATLAVEHWLGATRLSGTARHQRVVGDSDVVALVVTAIDTWEGARNASLGLALPEAAGGGIRVFDLRAEIGTREFLRVRPTWYVRGFVYSGFAGGDRRQAVAAGVHAASAGQSRLSFAGRAEATQMLGVPAPGEESTPGGFVEATVSATAPAKFKLALSGRFAPKTRWPNVDPQADFELPSTQRVDLSVNKGMWRDRLRAQLIVRNALNAAEWTHPAGAQWNLRSHVAITIVLPSVMAR